MKKNIKSSAKTNCNFLKKKKTFPSHLLSSSPSQCCGMYIYEKILITLNPSNCKHTVFLQYFLFFHPISNWHYLLLHSLFNILNSSQWLGVFLSNLVNLWTKFIHNFLNWIILCIVLYQLHILWISNSMTFCDT